MKPKYRNRRQFLGASIKVLGASLTGAAVSLLYARYGELYWLEVNQLEIEIPNLPAFWEGRKVVHATDLHISKEVSDDYIVRVFDTIRELNPSLVLYTGDYVSSSSDLDNHVPRVLDRIALGSEGTYAVLGNHDYGPSFDSELYAARVIAMLQERQVRVLRNELVQTEDLAIVGIDDLWADRCDPTLALRGITPSQASIALLHNPDGVELDGWQNFTGWVLSGHTHGGQCKLPFLPPPRLPIYHRKYASGSFELPGARNLYVSKGIGHSLQLRFCVRPEIAVFKLVRKKSNSI